MDMLKIEEIKDDIIKELEERVAEGKEIEDIGCLFADSVGYPIECRQGCDKCYLKVFKMLLEEVNEPIKLSKLEYEILKAAIKKDYKYIARDLDGDLFIYIDKPDKESELWWAKNNSGVQPLKFIGGLFKFVQWQDEEPIIIQNILGNCVIIDDGQCRIIEG